jgi:hypothetical protein
MSTRSADSATPVSVVATPHAPPVVSREVLAAVTRLGLAEQFPQVVELTRELFGTAFHISVEPDPEIANWTQVTITVTVRGTLDEVLDKDSQWHQRLPHDTAEADGAFCLSLDIET